MTMRARIGRLLVLLGLMAAWAVAPAAAQQPSGRIALVVGNGAYAGQAALPTAANDAGLVAQTLTAAGFDVTGARDLDGDSLRRAIREFLDKASTAGPDGIAFVYLSGYGLQFDGENFFVPVDATLSRDSDIPLQTIRLSDVTHALAALPLRARVTVVDGAYADTLVPTSDHIAPGLALVEAEAGSLVAFNAAPGTVAPTPSGSYGVYGQALAEMMRQGGVPADEVFDRVRLRVNETTRGAAVPWDSAHLTTPFTFLDLAPDVPATAIVQQSFAGMSKRAIREFPAPEAYSLAVARDTFPAYQEFLTAYPQDPNARRVRALLALRREALIWRQTVNRNAPPAYWTYLRRYPRGPHVYDCRRRLALIAAAEQPPESFAPIDYDVPPPPEVEYRIVERPTVYLDDVDDPPPPPPPVYFLPPEQPDFVDLPPPPVAIGPGFLPIPVPVPFLYARQNRRPGFIEPPRGFQGQYTQPQPFVTDPDGRLVARPGSQGASPGDRNPPGPVPSGQRGTLRPDEDVSRNPGGQPGPAPAAPRPLLNPGRPGAPSAPPPAGGPGLGQGFPPRPGGLQGNPDAAEQQRLQQQRIQQQQLQQRQQQDQQQRLQQQRVQQEEQQRLQQQRQQQEQQQRSQQQQLQQKQQQEQQLRLQQQRQQQEQQQRGQQQLQQRQQQEQQLRLQQQRQQQEQQQRGQQQLQQRQQQEQQLRLQQQRQQQEQQQRSQQQLQQRQQQEQQVRLQQQRQQQEQQQRSQQQLQQRQQQEQQVRMQQQRQQQEQQQRAQQQQFQQQRVQQQQVQQRQQQEQQRQGRPDCGRPGQPPCR